MVHRAIFTYIIHVFFLRLQCSNAVDVSAPEAMMDFGKLCGSINWFCESTSAVANEKLAELMTLGNLETP